MDVSDATISLSDVLMNVEGVGGWHNADHMVGCCGKLVRSRLRRSNV
jgi:hypothetical protein